MKRAILALLLLAGVAVACGEGSPIDPSNTANSDAGSVSSMDGGSDDAGPMEDHDAGSSPDGGPSGDFTCADLARCIKGCGPSTPCQNWCRENGSAQGKTDYDALQTCIFQTACPNTNGGVCDKSAGGYKATTCNTCIQDAQGPGGACASESATCQGGTQPTQLGCNALQQCFSQCHDSTCAYACDSQGTTNGKNLLLAMTQCLVQACPSTNGGVCDTKASDFDQAACEVCTQSAAQNQCASEVQACQNDQ